MAFRRDAPADAPEVTALRIALTRGDDVCSTGMVLLELLRGAVPPKTGSAIQSAFAVLDLIEPTTADYVGAADLGNACRKVGIQLGSVDALIARLVIVGGHTLLTLDRDLHHAQRAIDLPLWSDRSVPTLPPTMG